MLLRFPSRYFKWFLCPNCICKLCLPVLAMYVRGLLAFIWWHEVILNSLTSADNKLYLFKSQTSQLCSILNCSHIFVWICKYLCQISLFLALLIKGKRGNIAVICTLYKFVAEALRQIIDSVAKWLWWAGYFRICRKGANILD